MYEGDATGTVGDGFYGFFVTGQHLLLQIWLLLQCLLVDDRTARVRLRLVDFAHSFRSKDGQTDKNFLDGGLALLHRLRHVQGVDPENPFV